MTPFPYTLSDSLLPRLGVIVLQNDETLEEDFRRLFAPHVARLHIARIPSGADLNPDTLRAMEADLPRAADLFPHTARFAAVGYGCTSGAMMIGEDRVRDLIAARVQTGLVTNPLTATLAAIRALGVHRLGIVSPYIASVAEPLRQAFQARGVPVPQMLSFGEELEANVARIDPQSIIEAAKALAQTGGIDGIFLSCTNLRTLDIIPDLEAETGLPVLSSNQTLAWHLAWHLAQGAGVAARIDGPGRLWSRPVPLG